MSDDKLTIEYTPDDPFSTYKGTSDGKLLEYAKGLYDGYEKKRYKYIKIGNELLILAFRVLIKRGEIDHNKIVFKYKEDIIIPDKNGMFKRTPWGFCSYTMKFCGELLRRKK